MPTDTLLKKTIAFIALVLVLSLLCAWYQPSNDARYISVFLIVIVFALTTGQKRTSVEATTTFECCDTYEVEVTETTDEK